MCDCAFVIFSDYSENPLEVQGDWSTSGLRGTNIIVLSLSLSLSLLFLSTALRPCNQSLTHSDSDQEHLEFFLKRQHNSISPFYVFLTFRAYDQLYQSHHHTTTQLNQEDVGQTSGSTPTNGESK